MKLIQVKKAKPFQINLANRLRYAGLASLIAIQTACMSTMPSMGGSESTVTGAAAGGNSTNQNDALERCDAPLGTVAIFEDHSLPWWRDYRRNYPKVGSTVPMLKLMIQQSNCLAIVARGGEMQAMERERQLMASGRLRSTSNIGNGQMVAADYTLTPEILFADKTASGKAIGGSILGGIGSLVGGQFSKNEASTTLTLIDNRSGIQLASSVGSADNYDFGMFAGVFGGGAGGGAGGFSKTPEGKMLTTAFADSFNQMVIALRNYKPQEVEGGLGNGGTLTVQGQVDAEPMQPTATVVQETVYVAPSSTTTTTVVNKTSSHTVSRNKNYNFEIEEYDEDAFNNYYRWLKQYTPLMATMVNVQSGSDTSMYGGMSLDGIASMFLSQIDTYRIELEAWPYEARLQAWKAMGKRIESHSKIFERNRTMALANENLSDNVRTILTSIELVTEESLFPEGIN